MARNRRNDDEKKTKKNYSKLLEEKPIKPTEDVYLTQKPQIKIILLGALFFGFLNAYHVSTMFENDTHFSHLSNLEREMSFRTEMGFYYYHYKVIVESETFIDGLNKLLNENRTEYPNVINSLQRFNLFPEIFLGGSYHAFTSFLKYLDISLPQVCYKVTRGGSLSPVVSCEGIGNPMYWYLLGVWCCAGLAAALIFISGVQLSESLVGGFVAIACFFFNHGEATRVQWTPPLRESFAFPCSLLLNIIITRFLRYSSIIWSRPFIYGNFAMVYLLCWQFSQYTLVINLAILYCMYTIDICPAMPMLVVLLGSLYALSNALVGQFFSPVLLVSPLAGILLGLLMLTIFIEPLIQLLPFPLNVSVQLAFLFISSAASKIELEQFFMVKDDSHIFNLLKAKFSNFSDFHTSLYTCSNEFDFLSREYFAKLMDTLVLPCVVLSFVIFVVSTFSTLKVNFVRRLRESEVEGSSKTRLWQNVDAGLVYNFALLFVYSVMASLIMRLKLFLTPHLCIVTSLIVSKYVQKILRRKEIYWGFVVLLFTAMSIKGLRNISDQRSIVGEYSNPSFEELLEWINTDVGPDAAFAGPMPTMGNILLSTKQPIVNHPHYENAELRHRTKQVYSVFSRKPVKEVYGILLNMKVNYLILHKSWCLLKSKEGCGMVDLWDAEEPHNSRRPQLCPKLFYHEALPFHRVFSNEEYVVLQVPSKVVEIKAPLTQKA